MSKTLPLFIIFLIGLQAAGQKDFYVSEQRPPSIQEQQHYFSKGELTEANAESVLLQNLATHAHFGLEPKGEKISKTGKHVHYQLSYKNIPVYNAQVVVHFNADGTATVSWPDVAALAEENTTQRPNLKSILNRFNAHDYSNLTETYLPLNGNLLPVTQLRIHGKGSSLREILLHGDSVLVNTDLRKFNKDSTVAGYVFYPDPLTSANRNYGGAYVDNNDSSNTALNNERVWVNFKAHYNQGVFSLENSTVKMVEHEAPVIYPVTSTQPVFSFERHESGFEDVNCFYHINAFKKTIDSTGHNLPGFQVQADAHGVFGTDQSWYSPNIRKLSFGEGGVDDAEDPDVVVHEFGHAVVDGAVVGITSLPVERASLEEAICDYFAVAYSRLYSANQSDRVFNWDGHNEFWNGRMASSSKNYQLQNFNGSIYAHTDIMASCLSEIENNIGYTATMDIVLESLYRLTTNSTFVDFANSMVQVDQLVNAGAHYGVIVSAFQRRNVLSADFSIAESQNLPGRMQILGTYHFAQGGMATLSADEAIDSYTLYASNGTIVLHSEQVNRSEVQVSGANLPSGFYILSVKDKQGISHSFKLVSW